MSRFWGYSKRPKNWYKLLGKELTDEELDKAVIVANYKEPPENPKISATVIKPVSASPVYSVSPVISVSPPPVYSASPVSVSPDSSTSY